jgi:hypothetical protein
MNRYCGIDTTIFQVYKAFFCFCIIYFFSLHAPGARVTRKDDMETLDYQVMDSILVATLFVVFLLVLFGLYNLFKKVRNLEQKFAFMQSNLTDLSNTVKEITLHQTGNNKAIRLRQDDMIN